MRIGIFDSGLGGLVIHKAITQHLPDIDTAYLGDTLHVPYGGRSPEAIYDYSKRCVDFLFRNQDCQIIIMACNTASATALRPLQQQYLIEHFPNRRILGVVVPTLEEAVASGYHRIGLLATRHAISSNIYGQELAKINPSIQIHPQAAPLLVPLIEHSGMKWVEPILKDYLAPLLEKNIEALILGCTHYPLLKEKLATLLPSTVALISQDNIIPLKLANYLERHPEHAQKLSQEGSHRFLVTDYCNGYQESAETLYGRNIEFEKVHF